MNQGILQESFILISLLFFVHCNTLSIFETVMVAYYTVVDGSVVKVVGDLDERQSDIIIINVKYYI